MKKILIGISLLVFLLPILYHVLFFVLFWEIFKIPIGLEGGYFIFQTYIPFVVLMFLALFGIRIFIKGNDVKIFIWIAVAAFIVYLVMFPCERDGTVIKYFLEKYL